MATWRGSTTGCTGCYPEQLWTNFAEDPRGSTDGKGTSKESIRNGGYTSRAELIRRIPYFDELNKRENFKIDVGVTAYAQNVKEVRWWSEALTSGRQIMSSRHARRN
jgi:hypothetical protein